METILTINQINQINQIDYEINPNYEINFYLAKKDKIDYIYNTSALEGNAMTFPEVQTLLEGITVGGHKISDEQMILNQNRSINLLFNLLQEKKFSLSKDVLVKLHNEVSKEEALEWGKFRSGNVRIGGTDFIPPSHKDLEDIFEQNLKQLKNIKHPINRAISSFLLGTKNQYFYDGNKRTSRLIMNGELLSNGYPLFNIKVKDQLEFNKTMLDYYNTNDIEKAVRSLSKYYINQISELNNDSENSQKRRIRSR